MVSEEFKTSVIEQVKKVYDELDELIRGTQREPELSKACGLLVEAQKWTYSTLRVLREGNGAVI